MVLGDQSITHYALPSIKNHQEAPGLNFSERFGQSWQGPERPYSTGWGDSPTAYYQEAPVFSGPLGPAMQGLERPYSTGWGGPPS